MLISTAYDSLINIYDEKDSEETEQLRTIGLLDSPMAAQIRNLTGLSATAFGNVGIMKAMKVTKNSLKRPRVFLRMTSSS